MSTWIRVLRFQCNSMPSIQWQLSEKLLFFFCLFEWNSDSARDSWFGTNKWTCKKWEKERQRIGERLLLDMIHLLKHCYLSLSLSLLLVSFALNTPIYLNKSFPRDERFESFVCSIYRTQNNWGFLPWCHCYQVAIHHPVDGFDRSSSTDCLSECVMNCVVNYSQSSFKTLSGQSFVFFVPIFRFSSRSSISFNSIQFWESVCVCLCEAIEPLPLYTHLY